MANRRNRQTVPVESIDVTGLRKLFGKGRIATVVFTKKSDGSTRVLNGKTHVVRGMVGGEPAYDAESRGQIRVFDVNAKNEQGVRVGGYRTVTAQNVQEVRSGGKIYKVTHVVPAVNFVQNISHDSRSLVLRVVLDGVVYRYFGVPRNVYVSLIDATNKGKYFNEFIRGKYSYQRVS